MTVLEKNVRLRALRVFVSSWLVSGLAVFAQETPKPPFELKDGDRVVFLGDGFLDRERHYGYIETMLTRRFPGRHLTFRNLAWEGDSVDVQLRPLGFPSLEDLFQQVKPTVVFVGYGMNESFAGGEGVEAFEKACAALLDRLAAPGRRFLLVTPIRQEKAFIGGMIADGRNSQLAAYAAAVRKVAKARSLDCIDLFDGSPRDPAPPPLTDDGIHPSGSAYESIALRIESSLGLSRPAPPGSEGMAWREVADRIREAVVEKSRLWFHRWRAHNGEYIWGRRAKAFEGNAGNEQFPAEFAEIDRRIAELEAKIFQMVK